MARHTLTVGKRKGPLPKNLYMRGSSIYMKFQMAGHPPVNQSTGVTLETPNAVRAAQAVLEAARVNVRSGLPALTDRTSDGVTLRVVADLWLSRPGNMEDRTKVQRCDLLCAFFGDDAMPNAVTTAQVDRFVAKRLATTSRLGGMVTPNTVKREVAILRSMLDFGSGERLYPRVEFNVPKLRVLKRDKKRTAGKLHSPEKIAAFLAACPPDIAALFRFARMTGARRDELLRALRTEIVLTNSADMPATIRLIDTKSKLERTLRLNREALAALAVGLAMNHPTRVWPLNLKSISSRIHRVNKQLGHKAGEFITLRDMRHLVATQMYNSGMPIEVVMAQLGHLCRVTTDTYIHTPEDAIKANLHRYWAAHPTDELVPGLVDGPAPEAVETYLTMHGCVATG